MPQWCRSILALAAATAAVALLAPCPTWGADIAWRSATGGYYDEGSRWSGGQAPGSGDSALFSLAAEERYTVAVRHDATSQRLVVLDDTLELVIANGSKSATYTLSSSVVVGQYVGVANPNAADLLLSHGILTAADGIVGRDGGSAGLVMVDGPSTAWNCNGSLCVGRLGDGAVYIQNRATVSAGLLTVGLQPLSTGEVDVGVDGQASTLCTGATTIGDAADSAGVVNVTSGSTWQVVSAGALTPTYAPLVVGRSGAGMVSLDSRATAHSGAATVGQNASGEGTLTIEDASLTVHGALHLAAGGSAAMEIKGGGILRSDSASIAVQAGATGDVAVSGAGTQWVNAGDLDVGLGGQAMLSIASGGAVRARTGYVGRSARAAGTITVEGATSSLTLDERLFVGGDAAGSKGQGTVTVSRGAKLKAASGITLWGGGTLLLSAGQVLETAALSLSGGTLAGYGSIQSPVEYKSGEIQVDAGGTLQLAGGLGIAPGAILTKGGQGTLDIAGPQTHAQGSVLRIAQGMAKINSDVGTETPYTLSISAGTGTSVKFGADQHLASLTLAGAEASVINGGRYCLDTRDLAMDAAARLDLRTGSLVVRNGDLAAVAERIKAARNGGAWNGKGITSTAAALDRSGLSGLAAILNDRGDGTPILTTFHGQSVDAHSVLVAYVPNGDADLSGLIDADDYFRIDQGFLRNRGGYRNGDFDYSGTVDADDYHLIDAAFFAQNARRVTAALPLQAVPEPGVCGLGLAWVAALLLRRRVVS